MFDWNDLRFFLELHRSGRLLLAARRLKTTHATVARHIDAIEKAIGCQLFVQQAQGYTLTPAGQALLKHAEAMENIALLAQEELTETVSPLGKVRIGVTEGLGVMFLASRLGPLFERYPGLEVELVAVPRFVSIINHEADISILLEKPTIDQLIVRELTPYRLSLYASPQYLVRMPLIDNRESLNAHHWIGYVDDLLFTQELSMLTHFCRHPHVVFTSTSVIAQQQAAQSGLGLAVLPRYIGELDSLLHPVLPELNIERHYWICTRRDLHRSVRLRIVWDYLMEVCAADAPLIRGTE
jgi:DNA-binding transcriptional LysR family regulator